MWSKSNASVKKGGKEKGLVAVAIDKDKSSQYALRWALENLVGRGRPLLLLHVTQAQAHVQASPLPVENSAIITTTGSGTSPNFSQLDKQTRDLYLTFRCFCTRKDVRCLDVTLRDTDVARALIEYANYAVIENLVLGSGRGGLLRKFKQSDKPSTVSKGAPDFTTVYIVSKTKISSVRNASKPVPYQSPLQSHLENLVKEKPYTPVKATPVTPPRRSLGAKGERPTFKPLRSDLNSGRPTFKPQRSDLDSGRSDRLNERVLFNDYADAETDISFVGSDRTSFEQFSPMPYEYMDSERTPRDSTSSSEKSLGSLRFVQRGSDLSPFHNSSFISQESGGISVVSQNNEDVEDEMRRLKLELKQTMQMYGEACKEAVGAKEREKKQAVELHRRKLEEIQKLKETETSQEAGMGHAAKKKASKRPEPKEKRKSSVGSMMDISSDGEGIRYRKYTIDEIEKATGKFSETQKIGEGGYGPVFKCHLDHTRVAVKVLRPDAAQGRTQFHQEVEVLSCIRHPNMVLLLGACPEYGCLVYEYMANGSLEDRLFCKGGTPPLNWQIRFRIAEEVTTGLLFLHQTKPEPLVHRDLKPANILLDRYFVSKIGDVGLARLVPPSVADHVTQYRMTSTAGTFCYIDPEYQQTGMLGVKSDVYSLGVVLLQLLTAKPPMGLAYYVNGCIENGTFDEILDPSVPDWPVEQALVLAKIGVQCAAMMKKDRPDLGQVVFPELAKLRDFAEDRMQPFMFYTKANPSPMNSQTSMSQDTISDSTTEHSAASSSKLS